MNSRREEKIRKILNWDIKEEFLNQVRNLMSPKKRIISGYIKDNRVKQLNSVNSILGTMFRKLPNKHKDKAWEQCLRRIQSVDKFCALKEILEDAKKGVFIDADNDRQQLCLKR